MTEHEKRAAQLFLDGCNCAQAVTAAFSDVTGLDPEFSQRMSASFGGGIGGMREVCGAVSGMVLVAGLLYGYTGAEGGEAKTAHYALVQQMTERFRAEAGDVICRELLKLPQPEPAPGTEEFCKKRPCARFVMLAARLLDEYIREHPPVCHG